MDELLDAAKGFAGDLHLPSVMVGFAAAMLVSFLWALLRRTGTILIKLALFAGAFVFIAGAYFGWMRSVAGLGGARFSSPQQIIEDAQHAADKVRARYKEQQRILDAIEEPPLPPPSKTKTKARTSTLSRTSTRGKSR